VTASSRPPISSAPRYNGVGLVFPGESIPSRRGGLGRPLTWGPPSPRPRPFRLQTAVPERSPFDTPLADRSESRERGEKLSLYPSRNQSPVTPPEAGFRDRPALALFLVRLLREGQTGSHFAETRLFRPGSHLAEIVVRSETVTDTHHCTNAASFRVAPTCVGPIDRST
jgi:hypothetical protein